MTDKDYSHSSLMKEIKVVEHAISTCYERVYLLKSKLQSGKLSDEQKEVLKQELQEVEKLLATNKTILKSVHKQNRNTFLFVCISALVVFILWMLYHLTFGDKF